MPNQYRRQRTGRRVTAEAVAAQTDPATFLEDRRWILHDEPRSLFGFADRETAEAVYRVHEVAVWRLAVESRSRVVPAGAVAAGCPSAPGSPEFHAWWSAQRGELAEMVAEFVDHWNRYEADRPPELRRRGYPIAPRTKETTP